MSDDPIDAYLTRLRAELAERPDADPRLAARLLEETSAHLHDLAAELRRAGDPAAAAETAAVGRMGSPRRVVDAWDLGLATVPDRRALRQRLRDWRDDMTTPAHRSLTGWLTTGAWSAAGLLAGLALAVPTGKVAGLATMMLILPAVGAAIGLGLGAAQRRATRGRGLLSPRWLPVSAVGMALGLSGGTAVIEQLDLSKGLWTHDLVALALIGAGAGLVLSLVQSWALEARSALKVWWVLGTAVGLSFAFVLGGIVAYGLIGGIRQWAGLAVLGLVTSLAAGAATACVLESVAARLAGGGSPA